MFTKKPKTLYTLTTEERAVIEHAARQVSLLQRGVQHLLNEIGARERIPPGAQFNGDLMAFVPAPAETPGA